MCITQNNITHLVSFHDFYHFLQSTFWQIKLSTPLISFYILYAHILSSPRTLFFPCRATNVVQPYRKPEFTIRSGRKNSLAARISRSWEGVAQTNRRFLLSFSFAMPLSTKYVHEGEGRGRMGQEKQRSRTRDDFARLPDVSPPVWSKGMRLCSLPRGEDLTRGSRDLSLSRRRRRIEAFAHDLSAILTRWIFIFRHDGINPFPYRYLARRNPGSTLDYKNRGILVLVKIKSLSIETIRSIRDIPFVFRPRVNLFTLDRRIVKYDQDAFDFQDRVCIFQSENSIPVGEGGRGKAKALYDVGGRARVEEEHE